MNKEEILQDLNDEQKLATANYQGPSFIIAGPGAGKTRVLVSRTQYMIQDGINPKNIILFTFTNKAAREIKDRIANALGKDVANKITSGTYHSICNRILRKYGYLLGYNKFFSILDSEDSKSILSKITKGSSVDTFMLSSYISKNKRNLITHKDAIRTTNKDKEQLAIFYEQYQKTLKKNNSMDFDDLIFNTVYLLKNYPEVRKIINKKYNYITIDESHDSSVLDTKLIDLLAGNDENVCFILDPDQSIYSFRGANIDAVVNLKKRYENLKEFNLNRNYRCSGNIVNASNSLISHNPTLIEKDLYTTNDDGNKIICIESKTHELEAVNIANIIRLVNGKYGINYKDIAVLYRTNFMSREIEKNLIKYQIPYNLLSSVNFFSRAEIKDLTSYLTFINNRYNFEAFSRVVNIPKRGIGDTSINKIKDVFESEEDIDIIEACKKTELKGKAKKSIDDFIKIIEKNQDETVLAIDFFKQLIQDIEYQEYLESKYKEEDDIASRNENINMLLSLCEDYNIVDFAEELSLHSNLDKEEEEDKVNMLTMHMSKGLEYKCVILAGCAEGIIPHSNSLGSLKSIEEERRLMYVGMTRAKEYLFITYASAMKQNGWFRKLNKSRFLDEIDQKYLYYKS